MIAHRLPVGGGHVMHVEEHGNPVGMPVLVLHGGPGSGSSPAQRAFIDPEKFRILCPDQRGAGQSTPRGSIADNTLADLLADLRLLRSHLRIARWLVAGGSWGATLALLHAIDQPEAVAGLVLRNVFLAGAEDIGRFFEAASLQVPPVGAGSTLTDTLAELFATGPLPAQLAAAASWWQAEQRLAGATPATPAEETLEWLVNRYRIQSHYLRHRCWVEPPGLIARCSALPEVPIVLLQGSEDAICPPQGALALAEALRGRAVLCLVQGAGHDPSHPAMVAAMAEALAEVAAEQAPGLSPASPRL